MEERYSGKERKRLALVLKVEFSSEVYARVQKQGSSRQTPRNCIKLLSSLIFYYISIILLSFFIVSTD